MKKNVFFLFVFLLILSGRSFSQGFLITPPKLAFTGSQLTISYDLAGTGTSDHFYVWVEIQKSNGQQIPAKSLNGDVGDKVSGGKNKLITWIPSSDAVFLDEEVFVELKAEKYVRSFNKGSALLLSTLLPGLGQTRISEGKPWWLTGVAAYGALAGGIVFRSNYTKTYDSYLTEEDPSERADLYSRTQRQMNLSDAMIITGASLWAANILWVALTPNRYQPLKYSGVSMNPSLSPYPGTMLLTIHLDF